MNLLTHFEVHKTLGCDERTLHAWLTVVEGHYHAKNTYHNSTHAADVLQATAMFLEKDRIKRLLDQLDEACCLIAAITHDIDHPGKSRLDRIGLNVRIPRTFRLIVRTISVEFQCRKFDLSNTNGNMRIEFLDFGNRLGRFSGSLFSITYRK